jgi:hypothetical protein
MSHYQIDELPIRKYLLGELAREEQQRLEERLLTEDEYFERLLLVEDELIDSYVQGKLSATERGRFDRHFLATPEHQQKLRFAKALKKYVAASPLPAPLDATDAPSPRPAWWQKLPVFLHLENPAVGLSLMAALLLLMIGSALLLVRVRRLEGQLAYRAPGQSDAQSRDEELQRELAQQHERNARLAEELSSAQEQRAKLEQEVASLRNQEQRVVPLVRPEPSAPSSPVLSLILTPNLVRDSGSTKSIKIPPGAKQVQLRLVLTSNDYKQYSVALQQVGGRANLFESRLKSRATGDGQEISLLLPAKRLTLGDYVVKLSGVTPNGELEGVGSYYFRVLEQ